MSEGRKKVEAGAAQYAGATPFPHWIDYPIAMLDDHFGHLLGVALVNLAAIDLDINAGHF